MTGSLHAGLVAVGEAGILIRGPSGSGKSALAHALIREAGRAGRFARLVADDRTALAVRHGRLVGRAVPPLAGLLELRGFGLARLPAEPAAIVRLLVDVGAAPAARLPSPEVQSVELFGVRLRHVAVSGPENADVVIWLLCGGNDTLMTVS